MVAITICFGTVSCGDDKLAALGAVGSDATSALQKAGITSLKELLGARLSIDDMKGMGINMRARKLLAKAITSSQPAPSASRRPSVDVTNSEMLWFDTP